MEVREIMTRHVRTAAPTTTVGEAAAIMRRGHFRRLPVMENGRLIGIVVESDLRGQPEHAILRTVMRSPVITVAPDDPIEQAGRLMMERKLSVLPVLDGDTLVGILTESDIFDALCTLTGVMEPSTRIELTIPDRPEAIANVMHALQKHNVRVVSVVSAPPREPGSRRLILRLATMRLDGILSDLEAAGAQVVGPAGAGGRSP
jgi:acetoin utilization protein AcuB